jgi:hypothetical protein
MKNLKILLNFIIFKITVPQTKRILLKLKKLNLQTPQKVKKILPLQI